MNLIAAVVAFFILPKARNKWVEQALLDADCTEDEFGRAVAIGGDTAVVAAPGEYLANSDVCKGTVYMYVHRDDTWCLQAKLFVSQNQTSSYSFFGSSVALNGNTVLIAADSLNTTDLSTPVYVFTRTGENWSMQAQLSLPLAPQIPIYYQSVALAGDTAVAATKGKVYIFRRHSLEGTWSYEALLESPKQDNYFGDTVAIADHTIIVSGGDKGCASAYIFVRSARGDWLEQAQLTTHQSNGSNTVAISGNTAIIGTPGENLQQGAVYVFERHPSTGEWFEQTKLVPGDVSPFFAYGFGGSVAIDGDAIVVGTSTKTFTDTFAFNWHKGAAYLFVRSPIKGGWSQPTKLLPQNYDSVAQNYGEVVSISGDKIIVTAGEPINAVYIFKRVNPC